MIGALLFWTTLATPNFPPAMETLSHQPPPACTLCHRGTPMKGSVTTPFGTSIHSRGATAYNEDSLKTAWNALATASVDSDGDGTPDVAELSQGTDPNAGPQISAAPEPRYGCASTGLGLGLQMTLLAFVGCRRRGGPFRRGLRGEQPDLLVRALA